MPITIREILASDTISGAADKINFNFDQLLLNGGGPPGPPGPQGPIGPIGGRGIRGSVWYEGLGDPNLVPPTLTPEDEDNYLRGDGFVWTYNGSTWVNTTINLTGPVGPAGASGKFSEYQGQPGIYSTAGDTTLYPNLMTPPPGGTSGNTSNKFIKAVVIGGLPGNLPGVINPNLSPGPEVIASTLATQIVQPDVSLFVHQFNSAGGGIKFHGGDAIVDNFTNILGELAEIRLFRDDALYINVPKAATLPASVTDVDGLIVRTPLRGQLYQSGKRIQFQTGVSTSGYTSGDTNDFIVDAARNGSGSDPTIQLNVLGTTSAPTAAFRLGGTGTPSISPPQTGDARLGAGLITIDGSVSITGTSPEITLNGSTSTRIFAGSVSIPPANGHLTLGAASQVNMFTTNGSATGSIVIATGNSTPGNVVIATGTTSTGDILVSTSAGLGRVNITSGADNSGVLGAINLVTDSSSLGDIKLLTGNSSQGDIELLTGSSSSGDIAISTSAGAGRVNITSGAVFDPLFPLLGAVNIVTDTASTGNILVSTGAGTGDINLISGDNVTVVANNAISIVTDIGSAGDIGISTSAGTGRVNISSGATGGGAINITTDSTSTGAIILATGPLSAGDISINTSLGTGDVSIIAGNDVFIKHGDTRSVTIQPSSGNSNAIVNVKPLGANTRSDINIFSNAAGTKNLLIRSDSTVRVGSIEIDSQQVGGLSQLRLNTSPAAGNLTSTDDVELSMWARNHYSTTTNTPLSTQPNIDILSSGQVSYTSIGIINVTIYWQRVGNVINCSGSYTRSAIGGGSNPSEPLPIIGSMGTSIPHGSGTVILTATTAYHPVQIGAGATPNTFGITADVSLLPAISIKFSFSYVII